MSFPIKTCDVPWFPTCQVRVVRFYVSCLLLLPPPASCLLLVLLVVLVVLVQLRPAIQSVRCRTSTTTIHDQCSLPDLNHEYPRPVFPAGPQPRPSTPTVPCRTSTGRGYSWLRSGREHVGRYGTKNVQKKVRMNVRKNVRRYAKRYAR